MTASGAPTVDDLRSALEQWLSARTGFRTISDLEAAATGASNGTFLFEALGSDGAGRQLVLRLQPKENQFLEPDAMFQARVMEDLRSCTTAPVPKVLWKEPAPDVLGTPFFIMERIPGRVLSDTHHDSGWATTLDPDELQRLYRSAIAHLAQLHSFPIAGRLVSLRRSGDGTPLERHMAWLQRWHAWAAAGRTLEVIDEALAFVLANCPDDRTEAVHWGDARPGNMVFADDLSVAGLLDWELAASGPPWLDLGWWLMFEESQTSARGVPVLPGVPDEVKTVTLYEHFSGTSVPPLGFYKTVATLQFAIIVLRFVDMQVAAGHLHSSTTMGTRSPVTRMLAQSIGVDPPPLSPDYEAVLRSRRQD